MRARSRATASSIASLLIAFYREPALHRPALLHDRDGFHGGDHVFRFAAGKFPPAILRAASAEERAHIRLAACAFIRQVCFWDGANHYQVLGLRRDAAADEIKENYRLLLGLIHPDRRESDLETDQPWPTNCAQRANSAYETLGDPVRRALYDAETRKSAGPGPATEAGAPPDGAAPRRRPRRRFATASVAIVACAIAALGVAQLIFRDAEAPDWLPRAMPASKARDSSEPRFISFARATEFLRDMISAPTLPALAPPVAIDAPARQAPHAAPTAAAKPEAQVVLVAATALPASPPPDSAAPRVALREDASPLRMAQAAGSPSPAPATAPAPAAAGGVSTKDVDLLLAQLVSYYEAGDIDRLMRLFDGRSQGLWRTMQVRNAYEAFFRATRQRKLRIENLTWNTAERTAYARGNAEIIAEYQDDNTRLDRRSEIEIDITIRDGPARIVRLSLFPNGS